MPSLLEHLAAPAVTGAWKAVRRLTDALLGRYARRRVACLDQLRISDVQDRTLLSLVRRARHTRFGREHGFGHIRSVADYQRQVPLRDYEAFWEEYWRGPFPHLRGVTWPGHVPYLALSSGTTSGATKYLPVSPEMLASNRRAALTTLALFLAAHPDTPLLTGRLFFLGGSTALSRFDTKGPSVLAGDLSGIAAQTVSSLLRPFTFPPVELALLTDWDRKLQLLAERGARVHVTMLSGVPSWLLALFERLRQITGCQRLLDVWPGLRLILHGGTRFDPYRSLFRQWAHSPDVHCLETYPASEGFIAAEDPRHGLLRLLPDHGIFFEFVPVEDLKAARPTRHTAGEVEPGVQYAVVLTTCAGLWSYVLGDTVCFEQRQPPLLRFTGRTRYYLSAFGEHLIAEEVERAVASAAEATGCAVVDFHVGPVFPDRAGGPGRHCFFLEFAGNGIISDLAKFARELDAALGRLNEDYRAHRQGDLTLLPPEVLPIRRGGFADWLRSRGQLGGQHKVPRMDSSGELTEAIRRFFERGASCAPRESNS
jgi:hypothetical protein